MATRIWQAIQRLDPGIAPNNVAEQPAPDAAPMPAPEPESVSVAPQVPDVAPAVAAATADSRHAENVPAPDNSAVTKQPATKRNRPAKPSQDSSAPRETKLSQVVAMLQRPQGAAFPLSSRTAR